MKISIIEKVKKYDPIFQEDGEKIQRIQIIEQGLYFSVYLIAAIEFDWLVSGNLVFSPTGFVCLWINTGGRVFY